MSRLLWLDLSKKIATNSNQTNQKDENKLTIRKQNNEARNAVAVILYFRFYCLLECENIVKFMFPFQNFWKV